MLTNSKNSALTILQISMREFSNCQHRLILLNFITQSLQLLFQMTESLVSVGFGNSSGKMTTTILQEKYQRIERFGIKVEINLPKLKSKLQGPIDFIPFKVMVDHKRSQALLKSFLRNQDSDEFPILQEVQNFAREKIQSLAEELNTMDVLRQQLKVHKFVSQTNSTEDIARQYLAQFNNDLSRAVQVYKQRKEVVKKFSAKNKISEIQAMSILKDNGYNAALFEY